MFSAIARRVGNDLIGNFVLPSVTGLHQLYDVVAVISKVEERNLTGVAEANLLAHLAYRKGLAED